MGQVLVAARLYAAGLAKRLEKREAEEADGVREIGRMLDEAHDLARALARGLSPVSLDFGPVALEPGASLAAWDDADRSQLLIGAPGTGITPQTPGRVQLLAEERP